MPGITELAIIIFFAAVLGVFAKTLRQPVLLAYLLTGVLLVTAFSSFQFLSTETFRLFSDLGIMFLLFLVGLEVNYASLRFVGRAALSLGALQLALTFAGGFFLAGWLGFPPLSAAYLALAFSLSSTVVVVKLISDKHDMGALYAKLALGVLVLQDLVAMLALVFLSGFSADAALGTPWGAIAISFLKALVFFGVLFWLGKRALPALFDRISRSEELLFLVSLAWLFSIAAVAGKIGLSIEIAGFLAGFALSNSSEHFQIATKMRPLRDFFILGFFVFLGSSAGMAGFSTLSATTWIFIAFVLLVKPLTVFFSLAAMGYRARTNFFTGVSLAQVSEFSFVIAALGVKFGHIGSAVAAVIAVTGAISILLSSYLIIHAEGLARALRRLISFFERKTAREERTDNEIPAKRIILIGCHRTGESILLSLPKEDVLVADFDPEVIHRLRHQGIATFFGDMSDEEAFFRTHAAEATIIISTSPSLEDNEMLLRRVQKCEGPRPKVIVRAETERDAHALYKRGADYVLLPHFTSGQYLGKTVALNPNMPILADLKENDLKLLERARLR